MLCSLLFVSVRNMPQYETQRKFSSHIRFEGLCSIANMEYGYSGLYFLPFSIPWLLRSANAIAKSPAYYNSNKTKGEM